MRKALIVVDLEKGFITKHTKDLPRKIRSFIKRRGGGYDLILFTQYRNHRRSSFVKHLGYDGFMSRDEYGIVDELEDFVSKDNLFKKYTYSSFVDKKLSSVLKRNKITEVQISGIDTENCVLTFARDAFDRDYKVVVLKDLCRSHSNPNLHKAALEIIRGNIGEIR
ncbi:MAG: hypothetical protein A2855_00850 [Candidatus Liptonbacteria bacterium RIFCSPHIGHO2_01_FULL_57_28]|uniref:Isochorismatase-like domain-containing protein n=1 Tax=Candidatus Liptonbacteria bacterium RIFCSPHIGHO2_01_FULL_57_28 TaxID=1798647 RepID=A0A1G2CCM9_9BACT|nr:MAG: hypothetical protein A2855_00850 [Candidatus Liptonbacteria bacterium RIFCSPHIGHO2_01_FULL_57_28]